MNSSRSTVAVGTLLALSSLCIHTSCDGAPPTTRQADVSASRAQEVPSVSRDAPTLHELTPSPASTAATPVLAPATPVPRAAANAARPSSIDEIALKRVVRRMLSPALFKLRPDQAAAYFADISALQPQKADESSTRVFTGSSQQPWMTGTRLELHDESGNWRLGEAVVAWNPPEDQAAAFYARLVGEVQSVRGRGPNFGGDDSAGGRELRSAGWSWCNDECEAHVELDASGEVSARRSLPTAQGQPVVLLTVYTPEGP